MVWLRLIYLFLAVGISSLGAGIFIVRRVFSEAKLSLVASVGLGGIFVYLAAGVIYLTGISWSWGYLVTAASAGLLVVEWQELRRWWRDPQARAMLIGWVLIELWILLANLEIRHFAIWIGDWQEHYDRAMFFLQHWNLSRQVYGPYSITARPPMMNLIEAMFLGQVGNGYEYFQVIAGVLNSTLFLAVAGLATEWGGRRAIMLAAGLMALNPWFVQNATYPWTKLYCAFYVVMGVWFYWRSLKEEQGSSRLKISAILMLAAGVLVHYSAAIIAVFVVLHDPIFHARQWKRILYGWILAGVLLSTWGVWLVLHFGLHGAAAGTTTVYEAERNSTAVLVRNVGLNAAYSVLPRVMVDWPATENILRSNLNSWSKLRDVMFLAYEPGLVLAWGTAGLVAMSWILLRSARKRGTRSPQKSRAVLGPKTGQGRSDSPPEDYILNSEQLSATRSGFWAVLVLWTYIGGLLVCTPPSYYLGGVAHVILQPVVWIGMAALAGFARRMPEWVRKLCLGLLAVDLCWILLHLAMEGRVLQYVVAGGNLVATDVNAASAQTLANGRFEILRGWRFLGMETAGCEALVLTALVCAALGWWWCVWKGLGKQET